MCNLLWTCLLQKQLKTELLGQHGTSAQYIKQRRSPTLMRDFFMAATEDKNHRRLP
jgi:hypothetical protein